MTLDMPAYGREVSTSYHDKVNVTPFQTASLPYHISSDDGSLAQSPEIWTEKKGVSGTGTGGDSGLAASAAGAMVNPDVTDSRRIPGELPMAMVTITFMFRATTPSVLTPFASMGGVDSRRRS